MPAIGTASRTGTFDINCDAIATFSAADRSVAAVVDGIGDTTAVRDNAGLVAKVAVRIGVTHGGLAGLLTAGQLLVPDSYGRVTDAGAVLAVVQRQSVRAYWVGRCQAYGWDGTHLVLATPRPVRYEQLHDAAASAKDIRGRTTVRGATVGTVAEAPIHDPLVVLTSCGVHESVPHAEMERLVREFAEDPGDPRQLAAELVVAASESPSGLREDASAVVIAV